MNISDYKSSHPDNLQGFANFLGQDWSGADLQMFSQTYDTKMNTTLSKVVGVNDETNPGDEASLDLQYIMSIGNNVPTWSLTQQGTIDHINEPFVELFAKILNMDSIPLVLSVS